MFDLTTFTKITTLALADSVNPCEIAILSMVLITLLTQNTDNRKKVLYGGFAFISAVYIGYLIYSVIIIQLFSSLVEFSRSNAFYIIKGLGIVSMILGALNIKDYFMYSPGGMLTEMPLFMRPKAKQLIKKMTSPSGAFFIGILVTIFLLPCTAGPLVVASGILSDKGISGALPWMLYYNLIFILPMIVIVFLIYFGFKEVEDISGWKERNIKKMHLITGILLFLVGLAILMGWI